MIATAKLNGRDITSDNLDVVSNLRSTEIRMEAMTFEDPKVGDTFEMSINGSPACMAVVREIGQRVGHQYMVAEPLVTQELRGNVSRMVGPLLQDRMKPSDIARMLLPDVQVMVQPALDQEMPRWTTREREVAWVWQSLLRNIHDVTGMPVTWRHDARQHQVVVETNRDDWKDVSLPEGSLLQFGGGWSEWPSFPIQAGDLVDGLPVIYSRTYLSTGVDRTLVRTAR